MDGLEASRRIVARCSDPAQRPRIVAMTANAMQGDREECIAAGMDDYVTKRSAWTSWWTRSHRRAPDSPNSIAPAGRRRIDAGPGRREAGMQWNDWLGNLSYVLIAVSYLVTSMLWLRVLAILGLGIEALYFYVTGSSSLWVAIGWSMVFLAINAVQLARLLREMLSVRLSADERLLKAGPFAALGLLSFHRLMKAGTWHTLAPGTVLTRQRQPVTHLHALVGGMAGVDVDGQPVAAIRAGGIVGEMSLLSDGLASATVTVTQQARAFVIARADLERLLHEHEDLRAQFHQALGSELVAKLLELRGRAAPSAP